MDLKKEIMFIGFKEAHIEDEDPNDVYVKVWFKWKDKNNEIHTDGRQEFSEIGKAQEVLNKIIEWVKTPKQNWELVLD